MKPLPGITAEAAPFWEGCRVHELRYQRCDACGAAQFPPSTFCTGCRSSDISWHVSAGLGEIATRTIVHRAPTVDFRHDVPFVLALVDFDEGFRMMANVRDATPEAATIGARVRVIYEATERDDVVLPQVQLA